jgi:hypothetical protein
MAYVEWLRVRGCLKWTGIVLGALFLVAVVLRMAAMGVEHDLNGRLDDMRRDPGSQVSEVVLPDGTHRTTIYDLVKKTRAVIDDRGWNGKHIVVDDWSPTAKKDLTRDWRSGVVHFRFEPDRHGRGQRYDVTIDGPTPLYIYLVTGLIVAMIVATILGAPFAREAEGHLEIALTKPISRELLAVRTILADWAGMVAAFIGGSVLAIAVPAIFDMPHISFDARDSIALGAGIFAPLAWYAMLAAATTSLRRGYGAILGFAWPVAGIVVALSGISPNGSMVLTAVRDGAWALSFIDPLRYMHFGSPTTSVAGGFVTDATAARQIGILAALALAYGIIAIVQWRRIEA